VWRWPNELPVAGEPPDVVEAVETYNEWLQRSDLPKLLFYATPGGITPAQIVEWCEENLKNLKTVNIGQGLHYLQEDNPHLVGSELANWYRSVR
jgi:haloalkane dehalogenase